MTLQEIIDLTRRRLGDYELNYDWYDQELVDYANNAIYQMCRGVYTFDDSYSPLICNITTSANTMEYALSANILELRSVKITGELSDIEQTGSGLDDISVCGNYIHSDTDTDFKIQIDAAAATDTFKWSDDGGTTWNVETVSITGSWQELSHGIFIKFAATTGHTLSDYWEFTVSDNSPNLLSLTSVAELYDTLPSWRMATATLPTKYALDYRNTYITLYPQPDSAYLINMTVNRYPSTDMTTTSMSTQTPEIPSHFHMVIVDGIMYQAYMKTGVETFNKDKSDMHYRLFRMGISDMEKNKIANRNGNRILTPHLGTL